MFKPVAFGWEVVQNGLFCSINKAKINDVAHIKKGSQKSLIHFPQISYPKVWNQGPWNLARGLLVYHVSVLSCEPAFELGQTVIFEGSGDSSRSKQRVQGWSQRVGWRWEQGRELEDAVWQAGTGVSPHVGQIRGADNEMLTGPCLSFPLQNKREGAVEKPVSWA